jgi:dephospho-CoA kinase
MKRLIGITGGIGTGKSTVAQYLQAKYGWPLWDADVYAREAVAPGSPILTEIAHHYGTGIILPNGHLDRVRLGEIIFSHPAEKKWLESQIHPYVRDRFEQQIRALDPEGTAMLAIPLLFEAQMTDLVTEIWVVSCDRDTQLHRISHRDHLTIPQAELRIDSQMPLADKIAHADITIDNSSTLEHLYQQIDRL